LVKRRLIIVSASRRLSSGSSRGIPALQAYDGLFARFVRKYIREGYIKKADVLFVSPVYGLIRGEDPLLPGGILEGDWRHPKVKPTQMRLMNKNALRLLKRLAASVHYSEAYVNVGRELYPIIKGVELALSCKVVFAEGRGIGPKTAHMKEWALRHCT